MKLQKCAHHSCKRKAAPGKSRCQPCLDLNAKHARETRERRREGRMTNAVTWWQGW